METTSERRETAEPDRIRRTGRKARSQGPEISGGDARDHIKGGAPEVGFRPSPVPSGALFVSAFEYGPGPGLGWVPFPPDS